MDSRGELSELFGEIIGDFTIPADLPLPSANPAEAILLLLEAGLKELLGTVEWGRLAQALPPASEQVVLLAGIAEGVAETVVEEFTANLNLARDSLSAVITFYQSVLSDSELWGRMLKIVFDRSTTPEDLRPYIEQNYPNLAEAIDAAGPLYAQFEELVNALRDQTLTSGGWTVAEELIVALWSDIWQSFGVMFQGKVNLVITAAGRPREQGRIIGQTLGPFIIQVIVLSFGLYAIVQGAAKHAGKETLETAGKLVKPAELSRVRNRLKRTSRKMEQFARRYGQLGAEAKRLYDALASSIESHRKTKQKTMRFNELVRHISGLKVTSREYIELRLDSHHVIEGRWYLIFAQEFRERLQWESSDDMAALAIHTTWHIRNGARLKRRFKLRGVEKEPSLTQVLQAFLSKREAAGGIQSLRQLFDVYETFYKEYAPDLYWPRLVDWFDEQRKKL